MTLRLVTLSWIAGSLLLAACGTEPQGSEGTRVDYRLERPSGDTREDWHALIEAIVIDGRVRLVYDDTYEALSPGLKAIVALFEFQGQVNNGGFQKYLTGYYGEEADQEILKALALIGDTEYAAVFRKALATFPDGKPLAEPDERELVEISDAHWDRLIVLDKAFYALHETDNHIDGRIWAYIEAHPQEFYRDARKGE